MISYLMLGTRDLEASIAYYDALLPGLGATRAYRTETMAAWKFEGCETMLSVTLPFDGAAASVGNGTMIALSAPSIAVVDEIHAKALALGSPNEGDVGLRGKHFYAGYFRDPDGNKLNVFCYQ